MIRNKILDWLKKISDLFICVSCVGFGQHYFFQNVNFLSISYTTNTCLLACHDDIIQKEISIKKSICQIFSSFYLLVIDISFFSLYHILCCMCFYFLSAFFCFFLPFHVCFFWSFALRLVAVR